MAGLGAIGASPLSSLTQTMEPPALPPLGQTPVSTFKPDLQTAFAEQIPQTPINTPASIDNAPTLGDRVLAGLGHISSTFTRMDSLLGNAVGTLGHTTAPSALSTSLPTSTQPATPEAPAAMPVGQNGKPDLQAMIKSVEQQGIALYNQQFSRQVQFTSAEFEAHIVTVASQNMSSTLKSLLNQGG